MSKTNKPVTSCPSSASSDNANAAPSSSSEGAVGISREFARAVAGLFSIIDRKENNKKIEDSTAAGKK